ncbi:MAG: mechanosensitive ion channel family protein [Chloroflexota bacterium]|nr:MAG: mechanosensitive ion channel family protein [Chloroflexota bacterium]
MPDWITVDTPWINTTFRIIIILALMLTGLLAARLSGSQVEHRLEGVVESTDRMKRLRTLVQAGVSITQLGIAIMALLMVLNQFDIDIAPVLASAGIAGLALSLGSQTFIKDFFGGVLILVENQFTVGDIIKVGEITGTVERITLRATYLRDIEGRRVSIPNGDIRTVSNLSTEWARAIVNLNVPRNADMEKALAALSAAAQRAKEDESVAPCLMESPEVQGWVDVTDSSILVRVMAKTVPGKQWEVAQALRRYALDALKTVDVEVREQNMISQ